MGIFRTAQALRKQYMSTMRMAGPRVANHTPKIEDPVMMA